jgi:4-amino-4-deoxy-L-arabinose transferase-like glycosyltransferase
VIAMIEETKWDRWFWIGLALLVAARLFYAFVVPLGLVGDETYYWDWGRRPAWGYFSKPPLIAWLMTVVDRLGGSSTVGIRTAALAFGSCTVILVHSLARRLYGARTAFWAAAAISATAGSAVSNLIFTIDSPLLLCWTAALYCLWRVCEPGPGRLRWYLLLIAAIGTGLLAKQMMIVFAGIALIFLATDRELRWQLARPWPWAALAGSLAFLVPTMIWNARHDWITLSHTSQHFATQSRHPVDALHRLSVHILSQMGLTSPLLWLAMFGLFICGLIWFRSLQRRERFLLLFSGPALIIILLMTLNQYINGNWPAVFYIAAFVLLAGWGTSRFSAPALPGAMGRWFKPGVAIGAALAVLAYLIPFIIPPSSLAGTGFDPTVRLRGWTEVAGIVDRMTGEMPNPGQTFIVTQGHRYANSQLAFYTRPRKHVFRWSKNRRVQCQYELWPGPDQLVGWDALILTPGADQQLHKRLSYAFESVELPEVIRVPLGPKRERVYTVHRAHRMICWPGNGAEDRQ